jgi:hypothetical protein
MAESARPSRRESDIDRLTQADAMACQPDRCKRTGPSQAVLILTTEFKLAEYEAQN